MKPRIGVREIAAGVNKRSLGYVDWDVHIPGLSLMNEVLGLASLAEIPIVIVDVQRAGPSTGMPTKTEQSDLQQALYGTHGDAPRAVLAPTDDPVWSARERLLLRLVDEFESS